MRGEVDAYWVGYGPMVLWGKGVSASVPDKLRAKGVILIAQSWSRRELCCLCHQPACE